jgi:ankyrin repeat protein
VTDWLLEHGADANQRDADGLAPLHRAVIALTREPQQKIRLIDSLLKHGAAIDVTDNRYGMTPLHLAAACACRELDPYVLVM